jgi:hypothetical protein
VSGSPPSLFPEQQPYGQNLGINAIHPTIIKTETTMKFNVRRAFAAFCLLACAATAAFGTEGGGSTFPRGAENYLVGAVPPPGLYLLGYANAYESTKLKDDNGNTVPVPGFKLRADAVALRGIWSTPMQVAGGNIALHAIVPLVSLRVDAAGMEQHKSGVGDVTVGLALAHHFSPQLHSVMGLDFSLPTGSYTRNDLANIGRNYVSVQPLYALSYINPTGFNGDFKVTLNLNGRNKDTDYRSGREVFIDYSAGWAFGNGWTVGVRVSKQIQPGRRHSTH